MKPESDTSASTRACKVRLFNDEDTLTVNFHKMVTGEWLLDKVCQDLNLMEKYYFGLRFTDASGKREWLDLQKLVTKQLKGDAINLCLRVRYYPSDPNMIREEITRYYLFLQLRRDAHHGRLVPRPVDLPYLCALILQSELGDYDDLELEAGYIADIKLLPKQAVTMETAITNSYKELNDMTPAEAEKLFIEKTFSLDTYGLDPQPAKALEDKDNDGYSVHIGCSHLGVSVFQSFRRTKLFRWLNIMKSSFEGKVLTLQISYPEGDKKKSFKYKFPEESAARFMWLTVVDQQAFFTLKAHADAKPRKSGGLFRRNSTFRFSGKVEFEVKSSRICRSAPSFVRASNLSLNRSLSIRSRDLKTPTTPPSLSQSLPAVGSDYQNGEGVSANSSMNMSELPIQEESSTGEQEGHTASSHIPVLRLSSLGNGTSDIGELSTREITAQFDSGEDTGLEEGSYSQNDTLNGDSHVPRVCPSIVVTHDEAPETEELNSCAPKASKVLDEHGAPSESSGDSGIEACTTHNCISGLDSTSTDSSLDKDHCNVTAPSTFSQFRFGQIAFFSVVMAVLTLVLLCVAMYALFEADFETRELGRLRYTDVVVSFEANYYKPAKRFLLSLWKQLYA